MTSYFKEWIQTAFGNPRMLWLFSLTVPLLCGFLWWSWRRRQILMSQFIQSRLLAHLTIGVSAAIQKTRLILVIVSVGLLLLTLARPRWGFVWEEAKQQGLDIVIAIDTSRSMLAEDISPNRLARAKLAALDMIRLAKSDRLGLLAFAGTAFLQCPLTLDDEAFRQSVESLDVGIIPQGGTALTEAIETAAKAFATEGENHKVLVILTDGEDHESGAEEAAKKAAQEGLKIFTVGIGTSNGELLRVRDEKGAPGYIKDEQGNVVKSRLNETLLTQIATAANGFYLPMSGANTMPILYEKGLAPLPKSELSSKLVKRYNERYQWFLALAMLLLLIEILLPERVRVGQTAGSSYRPNSDLQKAVAVLLAMFWTLGVDASPAKAFKSYGAGKFKDAEHEYQRLLEKKPDDARLHYNAGAAAYQASEFEEAAKHFSDSLTSPDLDVQERSYYNLGDSLYRLGDAQTDANKKSQAWEQAIKHFEGALKLNPQDGDAKYNMEFVKKKLEELKKQQKESNQQNQQNNQKDDQNKKDQSKNDQNKDENSKDSQQQPKDSQDKSKQDQEKQQQQQKQQQDQAKQKEDEKKENGQAQDRENKDKNEASKSESKKAGDKKNPSEDKSGQTANATPEGQMTPEQVGRLLDAQKGDEKAMIFIPKDKAVRRDRIFKDW